MNQILLPHWCLPLLRDSGPGKKHMYFYKNSTRYRAIVTILVQSTANSKEALEIVLRRRGPLSGNNKIIPNQRMA